MPSSGIVFVATGRSYIAEVAHNLLYSKQCLGQTKIAIFTDDVFFARSLEIFDLVYEIASPFFSYGDKIHAFLRPPFDYNLFLDTDTTVIADISNLFSLLDNFDIAASHAPVRLPDGWSSKLTPSFFPEANTGVIFFRKSVLTYEFSKHWFDLYSHLYDSYQQSWDQASFRETLWYFISNNNLNFLTLPPEYNLRLTKPWVVGKGSIVYILHGRIIVSEIPILTSYLNDNISCFRDYHSYHEYNPGASCLLKVPLDPRF